jgi:hypothetical protein
MADFDVGTSKAVAAAGIDLLGPVLRGLSVDLLMRFWPGSWWRTDGAEAPNELYRPWVTSLGDRTQYMEASLARAWDKPGFADRLLRTTELQNRLFSTAWPGPLGDTPALILLTTDVGSGRRVAISHLLLRPPIGEHCLSQSEVSKQSFDQRAELLTMAEIAPRRDPTLLGAALTSARFPIVTPAATLPCPGAPWRLVDGGYFENSGLTTALELVDAMARGSADRAMRAAKAGWVPQDTQPRPVQVVLIRIENSDAKPATKPSPRNTPVWFPELFSPLRAFGGTRDAREDLARVAVERARQRGVYGPGCSREDGACVQFKHVRLKLAPCEIAIPLGWSLSERAKTDIRRQLGIESHPAESECVKNAAIDNQKAFSQIMELARDSPR